MSNSSGQKQGTAPAGRGAHWELFWRIIAGLMLITICWIAWVLYQIMPRSVVTPLAFETQAKAITAAGAGTSPATPAQQAGAAAAPDASAARASSQSVPDTVAAMRAMEEVQAALRAGAHQSSADVQAAALPKAEEAVLGERLKLSTEITTPLAERIPGKEDHSGAAPRAATAAGAAGKARP